MAQPANTFDTYDSVGNREELADAISMLTPHKTPFMSTIGKEGVKTTHPEWQTDELAAIDTGNKQIQGDDYTFQAVSPTTRVGNYTQISRKSIVITRTQDKTDKAGRKSEMAREIRKKGHELKRDMEVILLSNQASSAGNATTAPTLGGFAAWLETNSSRGGGGGADGGFNSGTGVVDAATNGTQRAFTKSLMDDNIEAVHNSGGEPSILMCSNYVKRVFSTFMSDASVAAFRTSLTGKQQGTIYAAADMYVSDFGNITVVPNTQMTAGGATAARNAFLITPDQVCLGNFQSVKMDTPGKTGDNEKRVLITEYTLKVKNEAAHGVIADLFGLTAAS